MTNRPATPTLNARMNLLLTGRNAYSTRQNEKQRWANGRGGGLSSRSWSVCSFVGLLVKEMKESDGFVAQKIAHDFDSASAQLFHARISDLEFVKSTGARILDTGAVYDFRKSGPVAGGKTHGTGLAGRIDDASGEVDGSELMARFANGVNFRVRGDVGRLPHDIVLAAHHFARARDAGAKRGLAFDDALLRFPDGKAHEIRVGQVTNVARERYRQECLFHNDTGKNAYCTFSTGYFCQSL